MIPYLNNFISPLFRTFDWLANRSKLGSSMTYSLPAIASLQTQILNITRDVLKYVRVRLKNFLLNCIISSTTSKIVLWKPWMVSFTEDPYSSLLELRVSKMFYENRVFRGSISATAIETLCICWQQACEKSIIILFIMILLTSFFVI